MKFKNLNYFLALGCFLFFKGNTIEGFSKNRISDNKNEFLIEQSNDPIGISHHYSDTPASNWRDALVSGNGKMGIMVYGDPRNERIILNHELLYEFLGTEEIAPPDMSDIVPEHKRLLKEGKYIEAEEFYLKNLKEKGHPGMVITDPYHPACAMVIHQYFNGEISEFSRTTTYATGELAVKWKAGNTKFQRRSFVSRSDNVIATEISGNWKGAVNLKLHLEHQDDSISKKLSITKHWNEMIRSNLEKIHPERFGELNTPLIEPEEYDVRGRWLVFRVQYQIYDRGYEVLTHVRNSGGKLWAEDGAIHIENSDRVEVFAKVIPLEPYNDSKVKASKKEMKKLAAYNKLLEKHSAVHGNMYNRISLNLDKTGFNDGSNEELIQWQENHKQINPYLLEKMFNMGINGLISSSGDNPPNLVGIWNGEWRPVWSADLTTNTNVQLQISAASMANQPEAMESYMGFLERIASDLEVNAHNLHGCRGYVGPNRTSGRRGLYNHIGKYGMHAWTSGAAWLLSYPYEYYLCTGDKEFMINRLLPMMKKAALFYEDFLDTYDENGNFLFAPSQSPENQPSNLTPSTSAVVNSTMDIAACKELLTNLIDVCSEFNCEEEKVAKWKDMLRKMPPYIINEDGVLKEWSVMNLEEQYDHRCQSHLYTVWPSLEINPEKTPKYFNAAQRAAEIRKHGNNCSHGPVHLGLIGARLKNAEITYENVHWLLSKIYFYRSLVTSAYPRVNHSHTEAIYNTDMLCGLPAVIMEMLVFSRPGTIEFLPAWSEKLPSGQIKGVVCRTQAVIESLLWDTNNKRIEAVIVSSQKQNLSILLRKGIKSASVNGEKIAISGIDTDRMELLFNKDERKTIVFSW